MLRSKKLAGSILSIIMTGLIVLSACAPGQEGGDGGGNQAGDKPTIVFADAGWDSIRFHNSVAKIIIENGYGYKTDVIPGTTAATFAGFRKGDINAYMELWVENLMDTYNEAIKAGDIVEVSTNFADNAQGLYVPTYVIKGDSQKGIEPMAPDLKTVRDLAKYPEVFKDPEAPNKGRIYGSPPGWQVDEILRAKIKTYELNNTFNYFSPGSDTALAASIASAVERGDPWVGYYWEPTWVTGKYDMTLLADDEYSDEKWNNGYACEWPSNNVTVAVYKDLPNTAPDVVDFLKNYKTSSKLTAEALAYMQDNSADTDAAAKWFLKEKSDVWAKWVPDDVADKIEAAIK